MNILKLSRKVASLQRENGERTDTLKNAKPLITMVGDYLKNQVSYLIHGNKNGYRFHEDTKKLVSIMHHLGGTGAQSIICGLVDMGKTTADRVSREYLPYFGGGKYNESFYH